MAANASPWHAKPASEWPAHTAVVAAWAAIPRPVGTRSSWAVSRAPVVPWSVVPALGSAKLKNAEQLATQAGGCDTCERQTHTAQL